MLHVPGLTAPVLVELHGVAVVVQVSSALMQSGELERVQLGGVVGATQLPKKALQAAPHHSSVNTCARGSCSPMANVQVAH